jgi:hypothetical protein
VEGYRDDGEFDFRDRPYDRDDDELGFHDPAYGLDYGLPSARPEYALDDYAASVFSSEQEPYYLSEEKSVSPPGASAKTDSIGSRARRGLRWFRAKKGHGGSKAERGTARSGTNKDLEWPDEEEISTAFKALTGSSVDGDEDSLARHLDWEIERREQEAAGQFYLGIAGWIGGLALAAAPAIVAIARAWVLAHGEPQTVLAILGNINIFALLSGYLFWVLTNFAILLFAFRELVVHGDISYERNSDIKRRLRYRFNAFLGLTAILLPILLVPPGAWQPIAVTGFVAYVLIIIGRRWDAMIWRRYSDSARVPRKVWLRRARFSRFYGEYPVFWGALLVPVVIAFAGALIRQPPFGILLVKRGGREAATA